MDSAVFDMDNAVLSEWKWKLAHFEVHIISGHLACVGKLKQLW